MAQEGSVQKEPKPNRREMIVLGLSQMLVAWATVAAIFYGGYYYCPSLPVPASNDFTSKLIYAMRWSFFPLVVLEVAILLVGNGRRTSKAANPLAGVDHLIQLQKNVLANTLEQFIVFMFCSLVLITFLKTPEEMRLVPLYSTAFVIGRILFRLGYGISWKYRGCGMQINFTSTGFITGLIFYFMFSRGFMFGLDVTTVPSGTSAGGKVEL